MIVGDFILRRNNAGRLVSDKPLTSLMAIDHPEWLLSLLCSIASVQGWDELERRLIAISGGHIEKGSKSVQMYIYTLTTLRLLEAQRKKVKSYFRTALGNQLCTYHVQQDDDYRTYFRSVILLNPRTGPLFKKYLDLVRKRARSGNPVTTEEVRKKYRDLFRNESPRTLYALGKETGMIVDNDGRLGLASESRRPINDMEFRRALDKAYSALTTANMNQLRKIYVTIEDVRNFTLCMLGRDSQDDFKEPFTRLLDSPKGNDVHIYGAPPQFWQSEEKETVEKRGFRYKGKLYFLMSIS